VPVGPLSTAIDQTWSWYGAVAANGAKRRHESKREDQADYSYNLELARYVRCLNVTPD